jgi:hypothetical protein
MFATFPDRIDPWVISRAVIDGRVIDFVAQIVVSAMHDRCRILAKISSEMFEFNCQL